MNLEINDYKVLLGAIENISIKGSNAVYIAGLIKKLETQVNKLEIETQENIKLDLPEIAKSPKSKT
jgi:hypothetical protein